mmetsp:Transcript_3715/g.9001  ORF Transcript_3715/g.9001 Transcript_3715/m.9001 type:complete len:221 (-) Transcript_3715:1477-2139(-)
MIFRELVLSSQHHEIIELPCVHSHTSARRRRSIAWHLRLAARPLRLRKRLVRVRATPSRSPLPNSSRSASKRGSVVQRRRPRFGSNACSRTTHSCSLSESRSTGALCPSTVVVVLSSGCCCCSGSQLRASTNRKPQRAVGSRSSAPSSRSHATKRTPSGLNALTWLAGVAGVAGVVSVAGVAGVAGVVGVVSVSVAAAGLLLVSAAGFGGTAATESLADC